MIALLNAAPNTGNQGVSALCLSAVHGLAQRGHTAIAVADHGRGLRRDRWTLGQTTADITLFGLTNNRRLWRGDCLRRVHVETTIGARTSAAASVIARANAVLDVSGGDSFTDLYGQKRFDAMVLTKQLALTTGRPLILLPQTLGPFRHPANRAVAIQILSAASAVWVRDAQSFDQLRVMLGDRFDPARHRMGVDMALLLPQTRPALLPAPVQNWLMDDRSHPVVGLNVSGLLCNRPTPAQAQFGLAAPHTDQTEAAARALLDADKTLRLVLISHVTRPAGDPEADFDAAVALQARLGDGYADRVAVLPQDLTATDLKWVIAHLDWFAGARMHATIAGLSSGVPTLGLGYSDKASGVFSACGLADHVIDLRTTDARGVGAAVAASFANRGSTRDDLAQLLPMIRGRAQRQMDDIAALCGATAKTRAAA